jgi:large subunit ribosomal protein L20
MPRARNAGPGKARKKKVLHANKGAFHGRRKLLRSAKENLLRSMQYAYRDRKQRKRMMRRLWILRINAAARQCGLSYNRLIEGLHKGQIEIDRKTLSELAVHDAAGFARIVETAKEHLNGNRPAVLKEV